MFVFYVRRYFYFIQFDKFASKIQFKMAQQRNIPQSKEVLLKSYNIRLKEDCKIMLENYFGEIKHRFYLSR